MGVGAGLNMYDVVVKEFTFAISSPDAFLFITVVHQFTNTTVMRQKFLSHDMLARIVEFPQTKINKIAHRYSSR